MALMRVAVCVLLMAAAVAAYEEEGYYKPSEGYYPPEGHYHAPEGHYHAPEGPYNPYKHAFKSVTHTSNLCLQDDPTNCNWAYSIIDGFTGNAWSSTQVNACGKAPTPIRQGNRGNPAALENYASSKVPALWDPFVGSDVSACEWVVSFSPVFEGVSRPDSFMIGTGQSTCRVDANDQECRGHKAEDLTITSSVELYVVPNALSINTTAAACFSFDNRRDSSNSSIKSWSELLKDILDKNPAIREAAKQRRTGHKVTGAAAAADGEASTSYKHDPLMDEYGNAPKCYDPLNERPTEAQWGAAIILVGEVTSVNSKKVDYTGGSVQYVAAFVPTEDPITTQPEVDSAVASARADGAPIIVIGQTNLELNWKTIMPADY